MSKFKKTEVHGIPEASCAVTASGYPITSSKRLIVGVAAESKRVRRIR